MCQLVSGGGGREQEARSVLVCVERSSGHYLELLFSMKSGLFHIDSICYPFEASMQMIVKEEGKRMEA